MTQSSTIRLPGLFALGSVCSLLLLSPASLAGYDSSGSAAPGNVLTTGGGTRAYVPPADARTPEGDHTGGGVRGCGDEVAAIAPRLNSVGQTASTHPTFVWYNFSDDGEPLEFQLYRSDGDTFETVVVAQFEQSQPGFMAYTLPPEATGLTPGETYLWQVVLYCDEAFEEVGQYSSAEVDVVTLAADQAAAVPEAALAQAEYYASLGLWYDAIAAIYDTDTPAGKSFRQALLRDLAALEEQPDKNTVVDLSAQLRQIAEMQ